MQGGKAAVTLRFLVVSCLLALLCACSGGDPSATPDAFTPTSVAATPPPSSKDEYRLSPGDLLDISVFQVPQLTKEVQVDSAGHIFLPLIGQVGAGGKTTHELETDIAAKLGAKYLQSPQVSVFVKTAAGQQVTVDGAVKNPGVYPIVGQLTLDQALARAGGINDVGDPSAVIVFRQQNGQRLAAKFDVSAIQNGKASDPPLYAGDMIVVDTSGGRTAWKNVRETLPSFGFFAPFVHVP